MREKTNWMIVGVGFAMILIGVSLFAELTRVIGLLVLGGTAVNKWMYVFYIVPTGMITFGAYLIKGVSFFKITGKEEIEIQEVDTPQNYKGGSKKEYFQSPREMHQQRYYYEDQGINRRF